MSKWPEISLTTTRTKDHVWGLSLNIKKILLEIKKLKLQPDGILYCIKSVNDQMNEFYGKYSPVMCRVDFPSKAEQSSHSHYIKCHPTHYQM